MKNNKKGISLITLIITIIVVIILAGSIILNLTSGDNVISMAIESVELNNQMEREFNLALIGNRNNYDIITESGIGKITIEDNGNVENKELISSSNKLYIESGIGEVNVNFDDEKRQYKIVK